MGVSTVTISIEEFEELIKCKRKLEKIKELKNSNIIAIRETNSLATKSLLDEDMEKAQKLILEQDKKNLIYMAKIVEVLESDE